MNRKASLQNVALTSTTSSILNRMTGDPFKYAHEKRQAQKVEQKVAANRMIRDQTFKTENRKMKMQIEADWGAQLGLPTQQTRDLHKRERSRDYAVQLND